MSQLTQSMTSNASNVMLENNNSWIALEVCEIPQKEEMHENEFRVFC